MSNFKIQSLIFFFLISYSCQACNPGENFCVTCDSDQNLCTECESEVFKPDTKGGCEGAKKCKQNDNHCSKCSDSSYLCEICEENYYRDNNGGCSNSENCEISLDGICKKCEENYVLIYKGHLYLECVSLDSEELRNCEEYDIYGHCLKCKENYYMNVGDRKCTSTLNCFSSMNGTCNMCDFDFYLDKSNKTNFTCLPNNNETNNFYKCISSEDGIKCDECSTQYFITENNICVTSKFCKFGLDYGKGKCSSCNDNYFLTPDNFSCTISDNCLSGYGYNEKCKECKDGYYNNLTEGICYSNKEDNEQKYCTEFLEKCKQCIDKYYLGEDSKCSSTMNCSESYLGNCTKCRENYYLGKLDNKCTNIENCSRSDYKYVCQECDDGYYLYGTQKCINDDEYDGKYKNCKLVSDKTDICTECKIHFYLDKTDNKCYDNTGNVFPKCSIVIKNSQGNKVCNACESPYYLGDEDLKCTLVTDCAISSEDAKICLKCRPSTCLNHFLNKCQMNYNFDEEDGNEVCYNCLETTDGKKCDKCDEGFTLTNQGYCIDETACARREGDNCVECKQDIYEVFNVNEIYYCLNYQYECLRSLQGCFRCDNFYNTGNCTECYKGYYIEEDFHFCLMCTAGCDSCTNSTNCGGCDEEYGYYTVKEASSADSYDAECQPCIEGCRVCSNNLDCDICYNGYFLNNKNDENRMKCSRCSSGCEKCFDESYCLRCEENFYLVLREDRVICEFNYTEDHK